MPAGSIQYENGSPVTNGTSKPLTMYDKIWRDHLVHTADGTSLVYIDRHLIHEVTSPQAFEGLRMTGRKVRRPDCTLATVDHNVPTDSRKGFKDIQSFIKQQDSKTQVLALESNVHEFGLTYFGMDDARQGIVHVIGPEQGFTLPGTTMVCGDSHTSTHGAFGSLAFGIGTSEVEHVLATQTLILKQSKNMRINVSGKVMEGVNSKDVVLHICGVIGTAGGTGHVIEFCGDVFEAMTMEARMSVCNMAIEAGARAGMVAPDETTFAYLKGRPLAPKGSQWEKALAYWKSLRTDPGAVFDKDVQIDGADIEPTVTWGTSPEEVVGITGSVPDPSKFEPGSTKRSGMERALFYMGLEPNQRMQDVAIQKAFIGSCTNSRIEDIRSAAMVARGRKVADGVYAMVVPGSGLVKQQAEAEGLDKVLIEAGFDWREPGCSMCLAMNPDKLNPHERCAATSNRNFEGRQGALGRTHLVSPAMAAAAAVTGKLTDVRELLKKPAEVKEGAAVASAPIDQLKFHTKPYTLAVENAAGTADVKDDKSAGTSSASAGMPKFVKLDNVIAAPLRKANVDTDCIIPKQFLKTIKRTGLGVSAFFELRYEDDGVTEKADFVLNQEPYRQATILIAKDNFGCGSSREHAPWSLNDFGLRCIIAPSFADIFFGNCFKNGMLPIKLTDDKVEELMVDAEAKKRLTVDLPAQKIIRECGAEIDFEVDDFKKHCLINGLDDIGLTMEKASFIDKFEARRRKEFSWLESEPKQKSEVRVSSSKSVSFYVRIAQGFLQGVPSSADRPERLPVPEIVITAIGSAIDKAVRVANELETNGDASTSKIATTLAGNAPQIVLTMSVKGGKKVVTAPIIPKDGSCGCSSQETTENLTKVATDW